jgi:hypothetical protein
MLAYAGVCDGAVLAATDAGEGTRLTYADVCRRMLAYAGVCLRMLAYACVCDSAVLAAADAGEGTQLLVALVVQKYKY